MIQKKTLTSLILVGIFCVMLSLSFAAVPLYDLFCRVTGFGGTTQISKNIPKIVLDKKVSVRFDTNVNKLPWNFKIKKNVIDVKIGQVSKAEFEVENYGSETTYGVASFNVSPASFGKYFSRNSYIFPSSCCSSVSVNLDSPTITLRFCRFSRFSGVK